MFTALHALGETIDRSDEISTDRAAALHVISGGIWYLKHSFIIGEDVLCISFTSAWRFLKKMLHLQRRTEMNDPCNNLELAYLEKVTPLEIIRNVGNLAHFYLHCFKWVRNLLKRISLCRLLTEKVTKNLRKHKIFISVQAFQTYSHHALAPLGVETFRTTWYCRLACVEN